LYLFYAKTKLQHWGKPLGSTPLFIILVGHYCMKMNILLHKKIKGKASPHSGTFGCPDTKATDLQPKEPSFCHRLTDQE